MILTPLLLDFSNKLYSPPVNAINSQLEVNQLTQPELSPIEYQVKITFPANNIHITGIRQHELTFNIPTHSSLQNKVRIQLPPSIGYGINSCYKVKYFEWQRPYQAGIMPHLSKVQKKKVYEEYWRVPTSDKFYLLSYNDYQYYKANFKTESITLTRDTGTADSLLTNLDVIDIKSIVQGSTQYTNWKLIDNSLYWRPYFEPLVNPVEDPSTEPTVAIEWLDGDKPIGDYQVNYIKPLTLEDILFIELEGKSILSNSYYFNGLFVNNIVG